MRLVPQGDFQHFVRRRHLEVQRQVDLMGQTLHVIVGNVTAVFTQVRRDPVGPGQGRGAGRAHGVRVAAAAGVSDGRDMVDVDAEPKVINH